MPIIAVLATTACTALTPLDSEIVLPAELERECNKPVVVGSDLTNAQIEGLWRADRASLLECEIRRIGLVEVIKQK